MGIQEVKWDKGGIELADYYKISYGNGNIIIFWGKDLSYMKESHQQLRG
jgi:hypothetical protein